MAEDLVEGLVEALVEALAAAMVAAAAVDTEAVVVWEVVTEAAAA